MGIEDEYVRDYSFDPEYIIGRKNSLNIHKENFKKRRKSKKPIRRKFIYLSPNNLDKLPSNENIKLEDEEKEIERNVVDVEVEEFQTVSGLHCSWDFQHFHKSFKCLFCLLFSLCFYYPRFFRSSTRKKMSHFSLSKE